MQDRKDRAGLVLDYSSFVQVKYTNQKHSNSRTSGWRGRKYDF